MGKHLDSKRVAGRSARRKKGTTGGIAGRQQPMNKGAFFGWAAKVIK
jgi:hypothetical protein